MAGTADVAAGDGPPRLGPVLVLALDTATAAVSVALAEVSADAVDCPRPAPGDQPEGARRAARAHIDAVLRDAGVSPEDVGAVVAGVGPGPYTGLRVGLVTAVVLGDALGVPTYGVCSLDGIRPDAAPTTRCSPTPAAARSTGRATTRRAPAPTARTWTHRPPSRSTASRRSPAPARACTPSALTGPECWTPTSRPARADRRAADRIRAGEPGEALQPLYLRHPDAVVPGAPKPVSQ